MGLLEALLGKQNPLAQWAAENPGTLAALGSGIGSGTNIGQGLSNAAQNIPQGKLYDRQAAEQRKADALAETQINATKTWLQKNRPDLQPMLDMGMTPAQVWEFANKPQPGGADPTANMQDWQFGQKNPGYWDALHPGQGGGGTDQPASVQEYNFAVSQGYKKDYPTFLHEKTRAGGAPSATVMKEIFEADEGAQAGTNVIKALDKALTLNDSAWDGPGADIRSGAAAMTPWGGPGAVDTQELQNIVTANALESLKATFGAAPTEGERKILLEVQGSVNQPRTVRKAIFERAKAAAARRLAFNKERGASLRSGGYFDDGYSPVGSGQGGDDIDGILSGLGI